MPAVFRQVTINGRPYLDGGVRHSVFVTEVQRAASQVAQDKNVEGDLYVVMNGDLGPTKVAALPAKLLPTLNRVRTITFNQIELASVYGAARRGCRSAKRYRGFFLDPSVTGERPAGAVLAPDIRARLVANAPVRLAYSAPAAEMPAPPRVRVFPIGRAVMPPNTRFAVSFNLATYRGKQGFSASAAPRVTDNVWVSGRGRRLDSEKIDRRPGGSDLRLVAEPIRRAPSAAPRGRCRHRIGAARQCGCPGS